MIDPICARRHCAEALWLAKTLGSPEFGVRALSVMAFAHVPDEPEEALRVASSAVADAARLGADVHARALINLGWIELTTGSGCPRNEFLRALSIAQRTGHRDLVVKARWGVGLTTTDLTHATTWLRSAVRMGRGIGLFRTSAHVALDLAMVLRQRRRSEADRVLDEVLTYALEVEDYLFAASVQWDKAGYLRAAGAYQAARHAYDKAREIWAEHDEPHAAAVTSVTIAAMLLDAIDHDPRREQVLGQRIATAREHLTTALVAFTEQLDDPHWAAVTSDLLGRLETKAGDLVEAAVRYEAAEEIRSIMNKE